MTVPRISPAILLFGPGTAILPSRPVSAPPARTAEVKGGAAGAPWRASPLTETSTLAALRPVGGVARKAAAERARPASDPHASRRGDRHAADAADIRCAAHRTAVGDRHTVLSPRVRSADGGTPDARPVVVRAPELRTKSASEPTLRGSSAPVGAGLSRPLSCIPWPLRRARFMQIVRPSMAPMPALTELPDGPTAVSLEPQSGSGSALKWAQKWHEVCRRPVTRERCRRSAGSVVLGRHGRYGLTVELRVGCAKTAPDCADNRRGRVGLSDVRRASQRIAPGRVHGGNSD